MEREKIVKRIMDREERKKKRERKKRRLNGKNEK